MSETMMQEILNRLDVIGEKLGEGAAFTWETMMRQAVLVGGWLGILEAAGYALIAFFLYRVIRYLLSKKSDGHGNEEFVVADEVNRVFGSVFTGIALLIFGAMAVYSATQAMSHIINPSYYALMDLARLVGK
jgi:TctA family transporter